MRKKKTLEAYALWLLGTREYSVAGLQKKCQEHFEDEFEEIEILIKKFIQKKYLDDDRFCDLFIKSQVQKGNGSQKIYQKLLQKGIDPHLAKRKCDEVISGGDTLEQAQRLADKKRTQIQKKYPHISDFEMRAKLSHYLAGRGFDFDIIREVTNCLK